MDHCEQSTHAPRAPAFRGHEISRREFVRGAGAATGVLALHSLAACGLGLGSRAARTGTSSARERIDHVIVLMQENRSFDHYFGWLTGSSEQSYLDDGGQSVATFRLDDDYRGCAYADPDHSWEGGRRQLAGGFLAGASDHFPVGYYGEPQLPLHAVLAREFTLCDNYFCSVLGPTYPNRAFMHSAQSGGIKDNSSPLELGYAEGFPWPTIWDRLAEQGVRWAYYYVDLPVISLWGRRLSAGARRIADFYADAADGTLPNVCFVDPGFTTELQTDEHPFADVRIGQAFVRGVIASILASPVWERSVLFVNYDEWGGFFDGVRPPRAADERSSTDPAEDFGQLGFRVPCLVVSPYSGRGAIASRRAPARRFYDHTSILKFIERRFGLRPLTLHDEMAADIGELLDFSRVPRRDGAELLGQLPCIRPRIESCASKIASATRAASHWQRDLEIGFYERMGYSIALPRLRDVILPA